MASASSYATTSEVSGTWSNGSNFTGAHSGSCTSTTSSGQYGDQYSMSFSVPEGATIDGIEVLIHCTTGDADDRIYISLMDTVYWKSKYMVGGSGSDCGDCSDETLGGPTDDWGGTWTAAHINSTDFRLRPYSNQQGASGGYWGADYCQVTVYYTEGGGEEGTVQPIVDDGTTAEIVDDGTIQKIVD